MENADLFPGKESLCPFESRSGRYGSV